MSDEHVTVDTSLDHGSLVGLSRRPVARWAIAIVILALYAAGQPWHLRGHISDVHATTFPAWHFVETGSFDLADHRELNPWFVQTDHGVWSNRAPGAIAVAVVGYAVTAPFTDGFEHWPGVLAAVITAWLSVLMIAAISERLRPGTWALAMVVFGIGTATWGVAAEQLWPHAPAQLALALSVWMLLKDRELAAGVVLAAAVLIRPPVVVIGVGLAVIRAITSKSLKPLVRIGLPTLGAAFAYLAYNKLAFGSWSPLAAYDAVGGLVADFDVVGWLGNVVSAFFSPLHGVLVWSAWLAVGVFGLLWVRGSARKWLLYTPLVGAAYIVAHSALEIASGALYYNYRYPLEAVALAAPILITTIPEFEARTSRKIVMGAAIASSILLQALFVFSSACWLSDGETICSMIP